ncbi:hypothetical protein GCM10018954_016140 [Kutzneria kofuensis]
MIPGFPGLGNVWTADSVQSSNMDFTFHRDGCRLNGWRWPSLRETSGSQGNRSGRGDVMSGEKTGTISPSLAFSQCPASKRKAFPTRVPRPKGSPRNAAPVCDATTHQPATGEGAP